MQFVMYNSGSKPHRISNGSHFQYYPAVDLATSFNSNFSGPEISSTFNKASWIS